MPVAAITGLIPIALAGGMALKFTEAALSKPRRASRKIKKRKVRPGCGPGAGNFSNLGI